MLSPTRTLDCGGRGVRLEPFEALDHAEPVEVGSVTILPIVVAILVWTDLGCALVDVAKSGAQGLTLFTELVEPLRGAVSLVASRDAAQPAESIEPTDHACFPSLHVEKPGVEPLPLVGETLEVSAPVPRRVTSFRWSPRFSAESSLLLGSWSLARRWARVRSMAAMC